MLQVSHDEQVRSLLYDNVRVICFFLFMLCFRYVDDSSINSVKTWELRFIFCKFNFSIRMQCLLTYWN